MRPAVVLSLLVLLASAGGVGCDGGKPPADDPYEAIARRHVKAVRETLDAVNGVKTEADAAAAVAKLERTQKEFEAIAAELKGRPKMTPGQQKAVEAIFRQAGGGKKELATLKPPKDEQAFRWLVGPMQRTGRAMAAAQAQWAEREAGK